MNVINMRPMTKHQSGTIATVRTNAELGRRIRDMRLVPGTSITIKGRTPLKDPVAIQTPCFTLTPRNSEADYIDVEVN